MQYKMIVFDVDGTIADFGAPVTLKTIKAINTLNDHHIRIIFASGKNISYIMGLSRGIGLPLEAGIGENGAVYFYTDKSGKIHIVLESKTAIIDDIKSRILKCSDDFWMQENLVNLTVFPNNSNAFSVINTVLAEYKSNETIVIMQHKDSIEVIPANINKAQALRVIKEEYNLTTDDVIAVGDDENDTSLVSEVGKFIIVGDKLKVSGIKFPDTDKMLDYLLSLFE
jgi:hydroxymethylpyrimidine pyrophosphatase-like HAD family hydrolase